MAGLVLVGLGAERFAPPLALGLAVVVGAASIGNGGWGGLAARAVFTSPLFAPVGWLTGRWFQRILSTAGDPAPATDRA